ncbi:MAG: zinc ribbon domain-containing protein [Leptolyngbya sp. BL-A-14]
MLQTTFKPTLLNMPTVLAIHCPNCGSPAERHYLTSDHLTRTQCSACDYLMVMCSQTGRVIEAYAPGVYARR